MTERARPTIRRSPRAFRRRSASVDAASVSTTSAIRPVSRDCAEGFIGQVQDGAVRTIKQLGVIDPDEQTVPTASLARV